MKVKIGFYNYGARPALPFSLIDSIPTNGENRKMANDGILEVEYGYYPQEAVSSDMQEELEMKYRKNWKDGGISETTNSYTIIERGDLESPVKLQEIEYNGKRYVRAFPQNGDMGVTLSNGEKYMERDAVWIEVSPVKWLVDEKSHMMITEKILFSGVPFNKEYTNMEEYEKYRDEYKEKGFDRTIIKKFMDEYFSKDLLQPRYKEERTSAIEEEKKAHSGEEAKDTINNGIVAYGKVNETYQEYSREASKENDDKTKEDI